MAPYRNKDLRRVDYYTNLRLFIPFVSGIYRLREFGTAEFVDAARIDAGIIKSNEHQTSLSIACSNERLAAIEELISADASM